MCDLRLQRTADGSYTLGRGPGKETYHSQFGAVTESTEVFLRNSGVQQRLKQRLPTNTLEIGFGSGLNFMLTSQCARRSNTSLRYTAYETALPETALITDLLSRNTSSCEDDINALALLLNANQAGAQTINAFTELTLLSADALTADIPRGHFHAIYLDAFSQTETPDFWRAPFLQKLKNALIPQGKLATYSVNKPFREALAEAGFSWTKIRGPAGKREVMVATSE